jgi:hypothetical protein
MVDGDKETLDKKTHDEQLRSIARDVETDIYALLMGGLLRGLKRGYSWERMYLDMMRHFSGPGLFVRGGHRSYAEVLYMNMNSRSKDDKWEIVSR